MELFDEKGCLSDEGLHAVVDGQLEELGRLEAAEHLAYCDHCMDRYTALLTADVLQDPPRSAHKAVMTSVWVRLMQNTWGRAAVAGVAAVLALTMWRSGTLYQILDAGQTVRSWTQNTTQMLPDETCEPVRLGKPVEDTAPAGSTKPLGKPVSDETPGELLHKTISTALDALWTHSGADNTQQNQKK